jgi:hypothetical protein
MYLRHLKLRNLKLLREVDISFLRDGEPRPWTVFVAENGLCKTTILQSIAMAASGPILASELADVISLPDRRRPEELTLIEAEFGFGRETHSIREYPGFDKRPKQPPVLRSWLETQVGWRDFSGHSHYLGPVRSVAGRDPLLDARRRQLKAWFVAGYGTARTLPDPLSRLRGENPGDRVKSQLDNLFDRGELLATSFAAHLDKSLADTYWRVLSQVLVQSGLLPRVTALEPQARGQATSVQDFMEGDLFEFVMGRSRVKIPAWWLSKGYQGTIAWVSDLIGRILLEAGASITPEEMEGLVLVDELDLHLHPKWQAALVPVLKKTFPRLQFIGTTHSAMLLPGLAQDEILLLREDEEGNVLVQPAEESPALMTGSELFDTFFGLHKLYPNELGEALRRYGYLASNAYRSDQEEHELHQLLAKLKENGIEPGWTAVARTSRKVVRKKTASKRGSRSKSAGRKR